MRELTNNRMSKMVQVRYTFPLLLFSSRLELAGLCMYLQSAMREWQGCVVVKEGRSKKYRFHGM